MDDKFFVKIPVLFKMDGLTIYQLRTMDRKITYLIEDKDGFHLTNDFPIILGEIQKRIDNEDTPFPF